MNEDQFLIANLKKGMVVEQTSLPAEDGSSFWGRTHRHLYLVADGVGGQLGGDMASGLAAATIAERVLSTMPWFLSLREDNDDDLREHLRGAVERANDAVRSAAADSPQGTTAATTLTMAYVLWPRMYVVHAGDSRCYLCRGGEIRRLTTDHTIAEQLVGGGALSPEQAEESRWSNVLWNSVGGEKDGVIAEVTKARLWPGDVVLLCTDGLTGVVPDDRIARLLTTAAPAREACRALVDAAKEGDAEDNVTALVARFRRSEVPMIP
jgi:protein phosphatase